MELCEDHTLEVLSNKIVHDSLISIYCADMVVESAVQEQSLSHRDHNPRV